MSDKLAISIILFVLVWLCGMYLVLVKDVSAMWCLLLPLIAIGLGVVRIKRD